MRHLPLIIDAIIDLVPEDFKRREDFKNSLSVIRGHSLYKAPEMATAYWSNVADTLTYFLGDPDTEWKEKIRALFADEK